jgi:putative ABC transport system permease protein
VPLQVSLSLVLLVGAALLTRNLTRLLSVDAGLDREHLLIADVDLSRSQYTGNRLLSFVEALQARIGAIPGVRAVSYSQNGLFDGGDGEAQVSIPGFTGRTADDSSLHYDLVGPGYVHAIGGRLLRGRDIDAGDTPKGPSVAVVNETLERFFFAGSAIGKTIYFDPGVPTTIVGVVADVKDHSLVRPVPRRAYAPYVQNVNDGDQAFLRVEVRTAGDPASVMPEVLSALVGLDRTIPLGRIAPLSTLMEESIGEERLLTLVAISFGGVAVLLAAIGLYGVMSYAVSQRTAELGVRCALGAERGDVLRLVLGDALRLVAIGAAIGAALAFFATQLLRSQLTNVPASDPLALSLALALLVSTAAVAALVPALRASRVPPVVALRGD